MSEQIIKEAEFWAEQKVQARERERNRHIFRALVTALAELDFPGPGSGTILSDAAATGFMGGDSGHGGNACISLYVNGGDLSVHTEKYGETEAADGLDKATLIVCGDWEQADLIQALVQSLATLARQVFPLPGEG
jgi:hypothetical protein